MSTTRELTDMHPDPSDDIWVIKRDGKTKSPISDPKLKLPLPKRRRRRKRS